jgi:hypothetical protein
MSCLAAGKADGLMAKNVERLWSVRCQERKQILKAFCADTVTNIRQIVGDMDNTRSKSNIIHNDYLVLLDVENNVFGRNREHLVTLPAELRDRVRKFVTRNPAC